MGPSLLRFELDNVSDLKAMGILLAPDWCYNCRMFYKFDRYTGLRSESELKVLLVVGTRIVPCHRSKDQNLNCRS